MALDTTNRAAPNALAQEIAAAQKTPIPVIVLQNVQAFYDQVKNGLHGTIKPPSQPAEHVEANSVSSVKRAASRESVDVDRDAKKAKQDGDRRISTDIADQVAFVRNPQTGQDTASGKSGACGSLLARECRAC
jgi:hypothetical protein